MSDMMLPFNVKKNAPPRPEENQIRPPVAWEPLYGTLFMMHSPHVEKIPGGRIWNDIALQFQENCTT